MSPTEHRYTTSDRIPVRRFEGNHRLTVSLILAALVTFSPVVLCGQEDDWFARDKALHFGASAAIAASSYGAAALALECRPGRVAVGAATALAAGVGKELYDRSSDGVASWKDLAWDVLGTAVGVALAGWIDGPDSCAVAPTGANGPVARRGTVDRAVAWPLQRQSGPFPSKRSPRTPGAEDGVPPIPRTEDWFAGLTR